MSQARDMLNACRDLAKIGKTLSYLSAQALANNAAKGLDWDKQDMLDIQETDGIPVEQLQGIIKEFLGSLDQYQTYWQSNGNNFEKLTTPIV